MPVYVKKHISFSPPISDFKEDLPSDYLQNPELFRDTLPQPFRFLNKVLTQLIDNAWEIIDTRETERLADAARIRPPNYQCDIEKPVRKVCLL